MWGMRLPVDEWKEAACRNAAPDVMFPSGQGGRKQKEERYAIRTYCKGCPILLQCRKAGKYEPFGIWGGETEDDRKAIYGLMRALT